MIEYHPISANDQGREKGKPRHTKAPTTEQKGETCEDEYEQRYIDLEQEVKEAEPGKNTKNAAGEATETRAEVVRQETKADEAAGWTAPEASAASAASADGKTIAKRHAAAPEGTVASEAQEMNEKDEKSGPRTRKEDNREARKRSNP